MNDPMHPFDPTNATDLPFITGTGINGEGGAFQWNDTWDLFWRNAFESRTYLPADARYEDYRGAYRYGHEAAGRERNCDWIEVESNLAAGWDGYEHRGECQGDWRAVRQAVRDGWARARQALKI